MVAGNVETSQAVTDALYGALGVLAASQGTMNNFTFGNARYQYYETIAGGAGAGPGFDGASAVQTHMTNSRLTDPEVLEWRFPVRLERSHPPRQRRRGHASAAATARERRVRFLEPMTAVMLANHRRIAPFGVGGRRAAARSGRNWVERARRVARERSARRSRSTMQRRRRVRDRDAGRRRLRRAGATSACARAEGGGSRRARS